MATALWPQAISVAVSIPDQRKGERIVLLTTQKDANRVAMQRHTKASGMSKLAIPADISVCGQCPTAWLWQDRLRGGDSARQGDGTDSRARSSVTDTSSSGVVLLHGLAKTPRSFGRMERALQKEGFATLNLAYPSRKYPLEVLVENVHAAIHPFAMQTDALYFVTHSMGGLLAQFYLARYRPIRPHRVVMLAPPNGGSEVTDFLKETTPYRAFYGPAG